MSIPCGRRLLWTAGFVAALAAAPAAQGTTGIPGVNDYLVAGGTSGASSCTVRFPVGPGAVPFVVSTAPLAPVVFLFNVGPGCPCRPCFFPWAPSAGCGMAPLGCFPPSNQALELDSTLSGCSLVVLTAVADAAGTAAITVVLPPGPYRFSTQAALLHPCDPTTIVFTQGYNVSVP
ncbi:MAG: hypothetical protein AAF628_18530 [Planctomycetota bacterium]